MTKKVTISWYDEQWLCDCGAWRPMGVLTCKCGSVMPDDIPDDRYSEGNVRVVLPGKNILCPTCEGEGKTYLGWHSCEQPAFTQEDFDREGPDFREDYFAGRYDAQCPECKGNKVITCVDEEFLKGDELALYEAYQRDLRISAEIDAEAAAERRYFYGY